MRKLAVAGSLVFLFGCTETTVITDPENNSNTVTNAEDKPLDSGLDLRGSIGFTEHGEISTSSDDIGIQSDIRLATGQLGVDFRVAGLGGTRNIGSGPIVMSGISGPVTKAVLYWHGPTNTSSTDVNVMVDGQLVSERSLGFSSDNCWGFSNSQGWAADITSIVQAKGNGSYAITGLTGGAVNSNGASMVVYFDDGNPANNRDVVAFEGNDSNIDNSFDAPGWNVTLPGINYTSGQAFMQMHVADGQAFPDAAITINGFGFLPAGPLFDGNTVPAVSNPFGNGSLWDIRSFNVTGFLTPGVNTLSLRTGVFQDCLALVVTLVDLPAGAAPPDVPVDNRAPVANAGPDQTVDLSGAPTTSVALDGTASTDDGRINAVLTYTWKEGATTLGTGANLSVTLSRGDHTITLTVFDGALSHTDNVVITVRDPSPPVITSTVSGDLGDNSWYTGTVTVTFSVSDLESAITSVPCVSPQVQAADIATQTFSCSATSAGGTSTKDETFKKDGTKPTIAFSGALSYTVDQTVSITCTPSDNLSGVASSSCGLPVASGAAYTFALGPNTRPASATDNAGNEFNTSVTFNVSVTYDSLCNLVNLWVTHQGVANSLCVKLKNAEASAARGSINSQHGQLSAFVNEVQAQSGQKVPADKAPILIALANALKL